ncbi:MAG: metalloregulator ArsR/SmtB family transcription factor [Alphaproteobacteria bacterium]|nr:metalloregulator ArsR/SmtB family transcription factor [Alphaproteobacteria bacterium]
MKEGPDIAGLAALIGDPARANMLSALMAGKALTAGELAGEAGVTPQTASGHLARLVDAGLLLVEVQGRHRYYRIAGPDVAEALETLLVLAERTGRVRARPGPRDEAMRAARRCYDHLAGTAGVAMFDALVANGDLTVGSDGLAPSAAGRARFVAFGIDMDELEGRRRPMCRACLDWSERRPHLAGSLGAALMAAFVSRGWATPDRKTRAMRFTDKGRAEFEAFLRPAARRHVADG